MAIDINSLVPAELMSGMSDDGELQFSPDPVEVATNDKPAETPSAATDQSGTASGEPAAVTSPDPAGEVPKVDWEKRYKDLQSEYTKTTQHNVKLEGRLEALENVVAAGKTQTPSEGQTDEDLLDALSDRDRAPAALKKFVADTLREVLGPETLERNQHETKVQRELREVQVKFPDFQEYVPVMQQLNSELSKKGIALSFEQLYGMARLVPKAEAPAKTEAAVSKAQTGISEDRAAELKAKAASLTTESGVAANQSTTKQIKSVKDALAAAIDEVYGQGE